ncbi:MAG: O-antigen ligase family protein [Patescibacteria group bacterium]
MKYSLQAAKFNGREIIDLLIEFVYLAIIFVVPLYFSYFFPTNNIFELAKSVIFQAAVLILFFLSLIKIMYYPPRALLARLRTKEGHRTLRKYIILPLIFIFGLGLSLFFSSNPLQSLYGSYERQAGYLSYLFYFLWFGLLVFNVLTLDNRRRREGVADGLPSRINRLVVVAVISSFFVSLYGILQIFGIDFLSWPEDPLFTGRTLSTFGQPNFLASWLLLVIPLSVYLIYKSRKNLIKFLFLIILAAQLACLFFTASRGGLLALALALFFLIMYAIFFGSLKKTHKLFVVLALTALIIAGSLTVYYLMPQRVAGLISLKEGSTAARVNFYSAAADAIIKKPIFGYGLENAGEEFIKYYQPDWGIYGDVGATTDRAHNLVLDILLSAGFFGLALFSLLYYYFFRLGVQNIAHRKMSALSLALIFGAGAYLLSLLFSFSIVTAELYFWLYLALIVALNFWSPDVPDLNSGTLANRPAARVTKLVLFLVFLSALASGLYYQYGVLAADYYFSKLYYVLPQGQYFTALTLADDMARVENNPINQEYYNLFLGDKLSEFYPAITELSSRQLVHDKLVALESSITTDSYQNNLILGRINFALGDSKRSESFFQKVIAVTPYWPKPYLELGKLYVRSGDWGRAMASYSVAAKILPEIDDPRLNDRHKAVVNLYRKIIYTAVGDINFTVKNYTEAEEDYQEAYRSDVNDYSLLKKIADTYYYRGDFVSALAYNEQGAKRNPGDYHWFLAIAAVYKEMGNFGAAKENFAQALKLAPGEKQLLDLKADF